MQGLRQPSSMALANVTKRKLGAFDLVNVDEDILVALRKEVNRLDGDDFAHIFVEGRMDRLNVIAVRDLYDAGEREV